MTKGQKEVFDIVVGTALCMALSIAALHVGRWLWPIEAYAQAPTQASAGGIVAVPESHRFVVVSQQILDSGAKLVIIRDTRDDDCYAVYEAGAGAPLGKISCR